MVDAELRVLQEQEWHAMGESFTAMLKNATANNLCTSTISNLFENNLIWGRGLFASIVVDLAIQDVRLAPILACIVSVINSKIPEVGRLTIRAAVREFNQWQKQFKPSDNRKRVCSLIAHLCNQGVCGELLPLEILLVLLGDSKPPVEAFIVAGELVKEVGAHLSSRPALKEALDSVFEKFREATHERKDLSHTLVKTLGDLQKFRQKKFVMFPAILPQLDILVENARIVHELSLDDEETDGSSPSSEFRVDDRFLERAEGWFRLKHEFLGEVLDEGPQIYTQGEESYKQQDIQEPISASNDSPIPPRSTQEVPHVIDKSGQDLVAVRKRIYLTINHGLTFEQIAHELLNQRSRELRGHDDEIVAMIVETCAQARSYTDTLGLLSTRLCRAVPTFPGLFEQEYRKQYEGIHRLETNKLRNIAMLFAQLLYADCLSWVSTFECVVLGEDTTTSSSRIFLKILFQRLVHLMGVDNLKARFTPLEEFKGLFPTKPPRRTRFAINYFTSIDLGSMTIEMRDWLVNGPPDAEDESSSSPSSSSSSSSSSSETSESERERKRKRSKHKRRSESKRRKKHRSESDESESSAKEARRKRKSSRRRSRRSSSASER